MALEGVGACPIRHPPHLDGLVLAAGDHCRTSVEEGDASDPIFVPLPLSYAGAVEGPHAEGLVIGLVV